MPACIATDCAGALETGVSSGCHHCQDQLRHVSVDYRLPIVTGVGLMYSRIPAWEVVGPVTPPFYIPWEPLTLCSNAPLQAR